MEESALAVEKEKEAQTRVKGRLRSSQILSLIGSLSTITKKNWQNKSEKKKTPNIVWKWLNLNPPEHLFLV